MAGNPRLDPEKPLGLDRPGSLPSHLADLGPVPEVTLLDANGQLQTLASKGPGHATILSLIYATCQDAQGCPLATQTLHRLARSLKASPDVTPRVHFLSISFDRAHDTPAVLDRYARPFRLPDIDWSFTVPASEEALKTLLVGLGQSVEQIPGQQGFSHHLRVYLVDDKGRIRNSYSASNLDPSLMRQDLDALMKPLETPTQNRPSQGEVRPGDDRTGYETTRYQTHTAALDRRQGPARTLWPARTEDLLGLPKFPWTRQDAPRPAAIALGRKLFFDRRLSANGTLSCALCHVPEQGFTSQEQRTSVGIEGRIVRRNAPSLLNVGLLGPLFHDGREDRLENQVWGPLLAPQEMGNVSIGQVLNRLRDLPDYRGMFEAAFHRGATTDTVGSALAAYERTLMAGGSPFDRWYFARNADSLSVEAQRGFELFRGKAGCGVCHRVDKGQALFTDQAYHNTGIGYRAAMGESTEAAQIQLAPGVFAVLAADRIGSVSAPLPPDLGRYEVTQNPKDRWKYRTPGLRNVALTPPYMHDGSLPTLESVVAFYRAGGFANPDLDPNIKTLPLTDEEASDLVAFLRALTAPAVESLVLDAFTIPIGNPSAERP